MDWDMIVGPVVVGFSSKYSDPEQHCKTQLHLHGANNRGLARNHGDSQRARCGG